MSHAYRSEADPIEPQARMPALGNILVATEFGAHGRTAIERAASLPFCPGGRLEIVHVATSECDEAELRQQLEAEREQLARALANVTVLTSLIHGDIAAEICRRAHHTRAELLVLGRHGAQSWKDVVLGSTAQRVVRHGSTSTLIAATRSHGPYCRPLVAVDLSASSRLALELAACISRPARGEICALHVTSIKSTDDDPVIAYVPDPEVRREMVFASAHKRLSEFLASIPGSIRWRPSVQFGDPSEWILEASRQRNCDVIALGSGDKGLIRRALLGSVAERIMHEAACDVLVARLPEA